MQAVHPIWNRKVLSAFSLFCGAVCGVLCRWEYKRKAEIEDKRMRALAQYDRKYRWYHDMPDLRKHHNYLSDTLNPYMYEVLRNRKTSRGFTFDRVIQPGVDNPGDPASIFAHVIAGDFKPHPEMRNGPMGFYHYLNEKSLACWTSPGNPFVFINPLKDCTDIAKSSIVTNEKKLLDNSTDNIKSQGPSNTETLIETIGQETHKLASTESRELSSPAETTSSIKQIETKSNKNLIRPPPPERIIGCVAGDEESYSLFADLFDPIILARHNFRKYDKHKSELLDGHKLKLRPFDEKYVISTRIRAARNLKGHALPPLIGRKERKDLEKSIVMALKGIYRSGLELDGSYDPLNSIPEHVRNMLCNDHLVFKKPTDPVVLSTGINRDWPHARGVYHSYDCKFLVWVNQKDHLRIISMEESGNIQNVYERFAKGHKAVEKFLGFFRKSFMTDDRLGYITTCPSNLGTGMRLSVLIKLPLLAKSDGFDKILKNSGLQRRLVPGEDHSSADQVFEISNTDRLGLTESELVTKFTYAIHNLITTERVLEKTIPEGWGVNEIYPLPTVKENIIIQRIGLLENKRF